MREIVLLCSLNPRSVSSGNAFIDEPRNDVLLAVWVSLSPVRWTRRNEPPCTGPRITHSPPTPNPAKEEEALSAPLTSVCRASAFSLKETMSRPLPSHSRLPPRLRKSVLLLSQSGNHQCNVPSWQCFSPDLSQQTSHCVSSSSLTSALA